MLVNNCLYKEICKGAAKMTNKMYRRKAGRLIQVITQEAWCTQDIIW